MEIICLDQKNELQYDEFLLKSPNNLFFVSNKYRKLLKQYLKCKDYYLLALQNDEIVGALPCFVKEHNEYGNVLNSLPYYGSNGSIIEYEKNDDVKMALITTLKKLCKERNCVASTIITSPFETDLDFYRKTTEHNFIDSRKGLISHLPKYSPNVEQELMSMFDSKQRNSIRKAQKSNIKISIDNSQQAFEFLYKTHVDNMTQVGGKCKEKNFFDKVRVILNPGADYDTYIAEHDGKKISALLIFYFNKTVEYFTPVIVHEYRSLQPLSLIITNIMIDASKKGFEFFNWGGTGFTQDGVYRFKKKFGAIDYPYYYFTNVYDNSIMSLPKEIILKEYDNFFVFPFIV